MQNSHQKLKINQGTLHSDQWSNPSGCPAIAALHPDCFLQKMWSEAATLYTSRICFDPTALRFISTGTSSHTSHQQIRTTNKRWQQSFLVSWRRLQLAATCPGGPGPWQGEFWKGPGSSAKGTGRGLRERKLRFAWKRGVASSPKPANLRLTHLEPRNRGGSDSTSMPVAS